MLLYILMMIFGQSINYADRCEESGCALDNIPFGLPAETVDWQMKQKAPLAKKFVINGGRSIHYMGYKFQNMVETYDFNVFFNENGRFGAFSAMLKPSVRHYEYPEILNLYFTVRDQIANSGEYDSVDFQYTFKAPYSGTTEKEAMEGSFSNLEDAALKQDKNDRMSKYRFGKVWAKFRNKQYPNIRAVVLLSYIEDHESNDSQLYVTVSYGDTSVIHVSGN